MIPLEPTAQPAYNLEQVLKTPEQSGPPHRQRGFFMPAPPMGRVRLPARAAARLCSSFHTLPAPLKTGPSLEQRSIPA